MLPAIAARRAISRFSFLRRFSTSQLREPGVVGLPDDQNTARQTLTELYQKTLSAVEEIPATAMYRTNVEKITNYRLGVVSDNESIETIEEKLGIGQMPEIIEQAQDELDLIPHMLEWKPWETDGKKPADIEVIA